VIVSFNAKFFIIIIRFFGIWIDFFLIIILLSNNQIFGIMYSDCFQILEYDISIKFYFFIQSS